jgi:hypothetical protein
MKQPSKSFSLCITLSTLAIGVGVRADPAYSLFNPVPAAKLRTFAPDRPSSTNSPYTVDAGHFQLELEAFNNSRSQFNFPNPNLRIGFAKNDEVDVAWLPLTIQKDIMNSPSLTGMGDLNLRLKHNLFGNDHGSEAFALMPGIKIPTNTNHLGNSKLEPTLMIPFSSGLPDGFGLSLMPEYDLRKNANNDSFHSELNFPITFGHRLIGAVGEYFEYVFHTNFDQANLSAGTVFTHYLGFGISPKITKNSQLDVGFNVGLNSATVPFAAFGGWVVRY